MGVDTISKKLHTRFLAPQDKHMPNGEGKGHHHRHTNELHPSPVIDEEHKSSNKSSTASPIIPIADDAKFHILVAATGSVASVKIPLIVKSLLTCKNVEVQVITTKTGLKFFDADKLRTQLGVKVWEDEDEWVYWHEVSDPVLHIELRRWAHLMLIAPLSANTLTALALGICDNLLTNTIRAWDPTRPILVAPAMNTYMYNHPITKKQLKFIKDEMQWVEVIWPIEKVLACKEVGMGGMAEWGDCVGRVVKKLGLRFEDEDSEDDSEVEEETQETIKVNGRIDSEEQDTEVRTGCGGSNTGDDERDEEDLVGATSKLDL